jgi:Zn-dependent protease with chaperone function
MTRRAASALALLLAAGCATTAAKDGETAKPSSGLELPTIPLVTPKGGKATLISGLARGPYEASSLAIGVDRDLARQRGEGLGFVRSAPAEQFLAQIRSRLVSASGVTGVPGRVMILANPAFAALSTPDGNIYVSMGGLESLESADEAAAILAHELAHVLLHHHTSDLVADTQKKALALHEIGVSAKMAMTQSRTPSRSDTRALANERLVTDVTDKVALPAWGRRQEREADLLGVDLLVRSGYAPGAMVSMLEKLQAWEKRNGEPEEHFWDRVRQAALANPGEALGLVYQRSLDTVSMSHPKTEQRLEESAEYLDRHYATLKAPDLQIASWKALTRRPEVAEVWRHYRLAFSARRLLDAGKNQDAYAAAREAATGRTATDAYPNWVLYRSARALGRQREAADALRRALGSPEPVPEIYETMILDQERAGHPGAALEWTDRASATFGGAPRWVPIKIRLLRKVGRTKEAETLTVSCVVNTPDWKRQCQQANQTPAGRPAR